LKWIALRGHKPGLGPAAESLSLLRQRKESKKGDRRLAPCGGARLCEAKNGKCPKLATLKQRTLLFPFSASHKRLRPKRINVKIKTNSNVKTNSDPTPTSKPTAATQSKTESKSSWV